jgi:beta-galactosidase
MKKRLLPHPKQAARRAFFVCLVLLAGCLAGSAPGQGPSLFFPSENLMTIGVFYYPEHWPRSQWERDFKAMASMGFEFTHFAEFAWSFLEPREGTFEFAWLDTAVTLAAKHGLKVILCTPTPCPPAWMGEIS